MRLMYLTNFQKERYMQFLQNWIIARFHMKNLGIYRTRRSVSRLECVHIEIVTNILNTLTLLGSKSHLDKIIAIVGTPRQPPIAYLQTSITPSGKFK